MAEGDGRKQTLGTFEPTTLLESIPDFAFIFDARGEPLAANSAALRMLGKSPEQFRRMSQKDLLNALQVGMSEDTLQVNVSENRIAPARSIVGRALTGVSVRHERRNIVRPDTGAATELSISASPICNSRGEVSGVLVVAHDVTELAILQRRLEAAERHHAIGQMAAALAHDFSNVLDTIEQAATVLELSQSPKEREEMIAMIHTAARRGEEIVSGVREYLRTGTGGTGPVDLRQVLIEAIELTRPLWQRAGIHLVTELQPVRAVSADAADLRRVFTNLIINAIEAMPHGGELTITCSESAGKATASVQDTGTGIAPEHQARIFFPYFTTKPQGTGLGLSGAQKILLGLGGSLRFITNPGQGTTFTAELPLREERQGNGGQKAA